MKKPLLSIIIPTKDRYKYLKECIKIVSNIDSNIIEVVVQDNTENNSELLQFFEQNKFKNFNYFHDKSQLSVSENSNKAILNSTGEFVCFIGDDDAVSSKIVEVVKIMKRDNYDSCSSPFVRYNWPDVVFTKNKIPDLSFPGEIDGIFEEVNASEELSKILRSSLFTLTKLPKVYQGIVSRSMLDQIYIVTGTYFPGASPDIANAAALTCVVNNHVFLNLPIIISGYSFVSAGGMSARGKHLNKLENVPWLPNDVIQKWDKKIPLIWSGETIWADSMIKGLQNMKNDYLLVKFNYLSFYARFIFNHPRYIGLAFRTSFYSIIVLFTYIPIILFKKTISRIYRQLTKTDDLSSSNTEVVGSLFDAYKIVNSFNDKYTLL